MIFHTWYDPSRIESCFCILSLHRWILHLQHCMYRSMRKKEGILSDFKYHKSGRILRIEELCFWTMHRWRDATLHPCTINSFPLHAFHANSNFLWTGQSYPKRCYLSGIYLVLGALSAEAPSFDLFLSPTHINRRQVWGDFDLVK